MQDSENIPKTIGRYVVKEQLGSGAMGCVYLAEDPRIKRKLAIKVVKLGAIRNDGDRQEFLARFQREAEVSGILNDPGIVTIYDVGDSELGPFLAMEYVPGSPLDHLIKSGETSTMLLRAKLQIACGLASALDHAHAHGIVHRDVKPGNVIVTEDGRPKLMDFGIAKREDASLTQTGTFLGTPSYASPEQIKEGHATLLSDEFSFGVLVFELLSGSLPFPGSSINTILYKIVNEPPLEVKPPVAGLVPEGWQRVFNKVLAKEPSERYESCSAFVRDLLDAAAELDPQIRSALLAQLGPVSGAPILASTRIPPPGDTLATGPHRTRKGARTLWIGVIAAGAVILALGIFLFTGRGGEEVRIATDPPGAILLRDGAPVDGTKPLILKPGDSLQIRLNGFETQDYVHRGGDRAPIVQMRPVVGEVTLLTDPSGAEVVLDSRKLEGTTPLVVKDWNQGQLHDLTFTHPQQKVGLSTRFEVGETPGDKVYKLLPLEEARSTGEVNTVDPAAPATVKLAGEFPVRVKAGGKDLGEVTRLALPPGKHRIELSNPRVFYRETRALNLGPGQAQILDLPGLAKLTVSTFPASGLVVVDGVPTGVESDGNTPIPVVRGQHTISIQGRPGSSRTVDVDRESFELSYRIQ